MADEMVDTTVDKTDEELLPSRRNISAKKRYSQKKGTVPLSYGLAHLGQIDHDLDHLLRTS